VYSGSKAGKGNIMKARLAFKAKCCAMFISMCVYVSVYRFCLCWSPWWPQGLGVVAVYFRKLASYRLSDILECIGKASACFFIWSVRCSWNQIPQETWRLVYRLRNFVYTIPFACKPDLTIGIGILQPLEGKGWEYAPEPFRLSPQSASATIGEVPWYRVVVFT
jgi:hypothetical protein